MKTYMAIFTDQFAKKQFLVDFALMDESKINTYSELYHK